MKIINILPYKTNSPSFSGRPARISEELSDLRVFHHHIYEFKKGIRNLILTTEKAKYKNSIEKRLVHENIDYVIHDIEPNKINVYFGA